MDAINITNLSLKKAHKLNSYYSTIESKRVLINQLNTLIGEDVYLESSFKNIHEVYNHILLKSYPNETSVKANFINNVLLKGKTHVSIFELPIINSRADLCKINGESVVYEIKTDLDTLNRLTKQIIDYKQIFDKTYVICSRDRVNTIEKLVDNSIGIYSYRITKSGKYVFKREKLAEQSKELDSKEQLKVLRQRDLRRIADTSNTQGKESLIKDIMLKYSSEDINRIFKLQLKNQYHQKWDFFKRNQDSILEIDYQWFYKSGISPSFIYG